MAEPPPLPPTRAAMPPADPGPQPKRMSGCLIALLVAAGLAVPTLAILAAIALPAYQQYLHRSQMLVAHRAMTALRGDVEGWRQAHSTCPTDADVATVVARMQQTLPQLQPLQVGSDAQGRCTLIASVKSLQAQDGNARLVHTMHLDGDIARWSCSAEGIEPKLLPAGCRGNE